VTWLELDDATLEARGGAFTAQEIARQPQCWRETIALLQSEGARIRAFLEPVLARPGIRVILTGAGTSAYIGQCLLPQLLGRLPLRVEAIATTDLVASPRTWFQRDVPTLLVSFARSGGSPESVAAIDLADQCLRDVQHLVVTCNAEGALYQACHARPRALALALPESTHDRGFAMTASFTSMLYAGLALMLGVGEAGASVAAVAAASERVLADACAGMRVLAGLAFQRVVFLGSGSLAGLAAEAALKVMELSDGQVATFSQSPLGFRHGPKAVVDRNTLVVLFMSGDALAARYDLDLLRELSGDDAAGALLAIGTGEDPGLPDVAWLRVPSPSAGSGPADDALLMFPYIACAQMYAFFRSLELGRRPDAPNDSGVVNRVVRGVTLHGLG